MYILTSENMKNAENQANKGGLSFFDMMDTAGTKCAEFISSGDKNAKTVILCGKGKNGGDGLVIARRLWEYGFKNIFVVLVHGNTADELCFEMFSLLEKYPVDVTDMNAEPDRALYHISSADVIVDAIFGIGFKGELSGNAEKAVTASNDNEMAKKYAVDIPSGLSADDEYMGQLYFRTDITLSMIAYKKVHVLKPTADMCGKTYIMDIGISDSVIEPFAEKYTALTDSEAFASIKKRSYNDHKGTYGKVLTVCGSKNMTGCVYLCNQAAVEAGAGLVTAAFPECVYNAVTPKLNEPLMLPLECNKDGRIVLSKALKEKIADFSVIAIGCGLGFCYDTARVVEYIVGNSVGTLILDADAINCISGNTDILKEARADIILTPHPGEMSRLTRKTIAEIQSDRINIASDFAQKYGVTVLLKGANTVIADKSGQICVNTTGNPGMARGGSGDVLTGIIAGLVHQTNSPFEAACTGAYIHGKTADYLAEKYGLLSATPSRIAENIFRVFP